MRWQCWQLTQWFTSISRPLTCLWSLMRASRMGSCGALRPFSVVLADFGEARAYRSAEEAFTARNRGTEVYKSPEMLMMNFMSGGSLGMPSSSMPSTPAAGAAGAGAGAVFGGSGSSQPAGKAEASATAAAALRKGGAGLASDIWSFGCLVFEVLTGRVLFADADYASVTHRVAFGGGRHLALTPSERAALGSRTTSTNTGAAAGSSARGAAADAGEVAAGAVFAELVEWILIRDPAARPSLPAIRARLEALRAECLARA